MRLLLMKSLSMQSVISQYQRLSQLSISVFNAILIQMQSCQSLYKIHHNIIHEGGMITLIF